jgi:hypothetical protein
MQSAEDFSQPLQVAVERRSRILGPRRAKVAGRDNDEDCEKLLDHAGSRTRVICLFNAMEARRGGGMVGSR